MNDKLQARPLPRICAALDRVRIGRFFIDDDSPARRVLIGGTWFSMRPRFIEVELAELAFANHAPAPYKYPVIDGQHNDE